MDITSPSPKGPARTHSVTLLSVVPACHLMTHLLCGIWAERTGSPALRKDTARRMAKAGKMHQTIPRGVREKTYSRGVSVFLECAIHSILDGHHREVTCGGFPLTKPSQHACGTDSGI